MTESPNRIAALLAPVATELGPEWRVDADPEIRHGAALTDGDVSIWCAPIIYGAGKGRFAFSGRYHGGTMEYRHDYGYPSRHEITVASDRAPAAIAGEIKRRMLPDVVASFAAIRADFAARDKQAADTLAVLNSFHDVLPALRIEGSQALRQGQTPTKADWYLTPIGYGDLTVYSDTVSITARSMPIPVARAVLAAMAKVAADWSREGA